MIFSVNKHEYVGICVDFNKQLHKYSILAYSIGMATVVPYGTKTGRPGGHFDQILTNFKVNEYIMTENEIVTDLVLFLARMGIDLDRP